MPNKQIQSLTVEGVTYDIVDNTSGYINAQYIENKTDYSIPVSRAGEIVIGETAIGTDSTNFPTSKAVVDYVDERVVQEMDAIDVGVTGIKANGTSLSVVDGVVNIPAIGPNQSVGLMTDQWMQQIWNALGLIPTSTSQLNNDSGFITSETDPTVPAWAKASTKPTYTANEVGALPSSTVIPQIFMVSYNSSTNTANKTYTEIKQAKNRGDLVLLSDGNYNIYQITSTSLGYLFTTVENLTMSTPTEGRNAKIIQIQVNSSNTWSTVNYKLPRKTSDLTNDSGYLTASDIASVMTYKGTKANYAALPASGNIIGDVWHLTDTGAEWAWDGSAWQELGTAIDLSGYATKATTLAGYGITDAKIQNGTITLGGNTITPLTSFTETDPVFSASAAAGITSSNITSWNGKIDTAGTGLSKSGTTLNHSNSVTAQTTSAVYPIKIDAQGHISEYGSAVTITDENLAVDDIGSTSGESLSYLIFGNGTMAQTRNYDTKGLIYRAKYGTGSSDSPGWAYLTLGNGYGSTTAGNKQGKLILYGSTAYAHTIEGAPTAARTLTLPNASGTVALTSDIPDTSSFLTTETDPVFSASAAAGITSSDISNWNAKVSDDKTWNGVELNNTTMSGSNLYMIGRTSTSETNAYNLQATNQPAQSTLAMYDSNRYLKSTTPSANDNSTKVATTAYVDTAIPKVYSSTNTGGYLTMATLPIYDGTVE